MKKRIKNTTKESIALELATHDVGKGYLHVRLPKRGFLDVEEEQITPVIRKMAESRRGRRPVLKIEDVPGAPKKNGLKTLEPTFACPDCDEKFTIESDLDQHVVMAHTEAQEEPAVNEDPVES